jgi:hypothetical protein
MRKQKAIGNERTYASIYHHIMTDVNNSEFARSKQHEIIANTERSSGLDDDRREAGIYSPQHAPIRNLLEPAKECQ